MDLAASSGFVAEPAESSIYHRSPRSPKEKFLDAHMIQKILVSGLSLFAAVMVSYGLALSRNFSITQAQTIAFSAWIIGHIILAFVSRSEKEPLYALGIFSNKAINIWAISAMAFLLVVTQIPTLGTQLKLQNVTLVQLGLVFVISLCAIFWREIVKIALYKNGHNQSMANVV